MTNPSVSPLSGATTVFLRTGSVGIRAHEWRERSPDGTTPWFGSCQRNNASAVAEVVAERVHRYASLEENLRQVHSADSFESTSR